MSNFSYFNHFKNKLCICIYIYIEKYIESINIHILIHLGKRDFLATMHNKKKKCNHRSL